jgi:hypothetical protein
VAARLRRRQGYLRGEREVIETAVSPATALSVGLKVDAEAVPPGVLAAADLDSPATTVELIRLPAYGDLVELLKTL